MANSDPVSHKSLYPGIRLVVESLLARPNHSVILPNQQDELYPGVCLVVEALSANVGSNGRPDPWRATTDPQDQYESR